MKQGDSVSTPAASSNDQPVSTGDPFKPARFLLLLLLVAFGLALTWGASKRTTGVDFYQFWVVGQALNRPGVNIYSDADRTRLGEEFLEKATQTRDEQLIAVASYRRKLETYSSPFLYSLFHWFSAGQLEFDDRNYRLLLIASLALSVFLLTRLLNQPCEITLGALAVFFAWFSPFLSDMRVGNVNSLQLAAVAIYLWVILRVRWRHRDVLGGVLLGLAIAFKPNLIFIPALMGAHWLLNREWRRLLLQALGAVAGGLLAVGLASAAFGSVQCWFNWVAAVRSLPDHIIPVAYGNFAPARLLSETFGVNARLPLAIIVCGLPVFLLALRRRTRPGPVDETLLVSIACLMVLLATRLAWLHYYVLAIPAVLYLLRPPAEGSCRRCLKLAYGMVGLALVAFAMEALAQFGLLPAPKGQAVLVIAAAAALYALMLVRLVARIPQQSSVGATSL